MILEGFLSGVVSNVLKEVITQAIVRKWKRFDEKEVEKIVAAYLTQQPLTTQTIPIVKEVYLLMGTSGLIDASGQLMLSPSNEGPEQVFQRVYDGWYNAATYEIVSEFSRKVLDVWCYGTEDGVRIVQHRYLGGTNQHWRLIPVVGRGDLYKIVSVFSGKVLDVWNKGIEDGVQIVQHRYLGGANQHWRLVPVSSQSDTVKIVSEFSGKVLDVWCYGTEDGVRIVQHRYLGGTNQHWRLIWIHSS